MTLIFNVFNGFVHNICCTSWSFLIFIMLLLLL